MAPRNFRTGNKPINYATRAIVLIALIVFTAWVLMFPSQPGLKKASQTIENATVRDTKLVDSDDIKEIKNGLNSKGGEDAEDEVADENSNRNGKEGEEDEEKGDGAAEEKENWENEKRIWNVDSSKMKTKSSSSSNIQSQNSLINTMRQKVDEEEAKDQSLVHSKEDQLNESKNELKYKRNSVVDGEGGEESQRIEKTKTRGEGVEEGEGEIEARNEGEGSSNEKVSNEYAESSSLQSSMSVDSNRGKTTESVDDEFENTDLDENSSLELFLNKIKVNPKGQITRWGEVISKDSIMSSKNNGEEISEQNLNGENEGKAILPNASSPSPSLSPPSLPYCSMDEVNLIPCFSDVEAYERLCPSSLNQKHKKLCLIPMPTGYKTPNLWPRSVNEVWYDNVPRPNLKKWKRIYDFIKREGNKFVFISNSTEQEEEEEEIRNYVNEIEKAVPDISFGNRIQVVLDVRAGLSSFSAYLSKRHVTVLSISHKDKLGSVQMALERGLPSFLSSFNGNHHLPFPSLAFDMIHCFQCRVAWEKEGGKYLLEAYRILRTHGYFVWTSESKRFEKWEFISLTKSMCLTLISKVNLGSVTLVILKKSKLNDCSSQNQNQIQNENENEEENLNLNLNLNQTSFKSNFTFCKKDDSDFVWQVPLEPCLPLPQTSASERGMEWPPLGKERITSPPKWVQDIPVSNYSNQPTLEAFSKDQFFWDRVVWRTYVPKLGIEWKTLRNVMDMNALYGGFATALTNFPLWVMNVVSTNSSNTLGTIYDRGLIGINHDWCEPFDSYPRSYDLIHSNYILSFQSKSCDLMQILIEIDRLLRPNGFFIIREDERFFLLWKEKIVRELGWRINFSFNRIGRSVVLFQKYVGSLNG